MAGSDAYFLDLDVEGGTPWYPEERALPEANALWDTQMEALASVGARVGPYELLDLLGTGAMAVVFGGRHAETGAPVAIKVLKHKAPAQALERFKREAAVMSTLRHENVVGVRLCGILAARPFLVLERLGGGSVRQLMTARPRLPVDEALRVAVDALRGLAAVHHLGLVHRDIKPENLLLAEDGTTKVADFGMVKLVRGGDGLELTQDGQTVGTPVYMSPEQSAAFELAGQSDVYSLGLVLHEMLVGDVPTFGGRTILEMIHRRHDAPPPHVRADRPDVPVDVDEVLAHMLRPKFNQRPTAAEACRLLELALTNVTRAAAPFRRVALALLWRDQVRFLDLGGEGAELVLGRSVRADVTVEDDRASRRHCALRTTPGGLVALDLGSTNGSWVGETQLGSEPVSFASGSVLRVADTELRVVWAPARERADGALGMV